MITTGIDVGNENVKAVILRDECILSTSIVPIKGESSGAVDKVMEDALAKANLSRKDLDYTVATGAGREKISWCDEKTSDFLCHAKGAHWLFPSAKTIITIGAENSQVLRCDGKGNLTNFLINDKCASGTGVFLETMAKLMELDLEEMGRLSFQSQREIEINTMCAVFAESEVITEVHKGTPKVDIIRGIHDSVAKKTASMVKRLGVEKDVVITGGGAKNVGLVEAMKRQLVVEILVPEDPSITGALGAALLGRQRKEGKK